MDNGDSGGTAKRCRTAPPSGATHSGRHRHGDTETSDLITETWNEIVGPDSALRVPDVPRRLIRPEDEFRMTVTGIHDRTGPLFAIQTEARAR